MLEGQSILCFAPDPWDDIWRNRHQIMSILAQQNTVLYVEPRPYVRSVLADLRRRPLCEAREWMRPHSLRQVQPGLYVHRPPRYAPLCGRDPLRAWTRALREAALLRAMADLGMSRPIVWLFRPDAADVPGRFGERMLIYHIVDEYLGYSDVRSGEGTARKDDIARRERELITRADLVLVTSKSLLANKGGLNPNTHWVPNAVNYAAFAEAAAERREPPELAGVPRPRIGYVGALNDKVDVALLEEVARAFPRAALVLVGPERPGTEATRVGLARLRSLSNVWMPGRVPVERVPELVAACDVGLLPYRRNAWTEAIHPLKLYEYLACGLPVVATDIPSVRDEAALLSIATDAEGYVSAVRAALGECDSSVAGERRTLPLRQARQARAAQNTWLQRVEQISELVTQTVLRSTPVSRP